MQRCLSGGGETSGDRQEIKPRYLRADDGTKTKREADDGGAERQTVRDGRTDMRS